MLRARALPAITVVASLALSALLLRALPSDAAAGATPARPARPRRIVSLSLPADEVLLAITEPDRILALEEFVDDPEASRAVEEARAIERRVPMSVDAIAALEPDLVLMPPWADASIGALLTRFGVPVLAVPTPTSIDEVEAGVRAIGEAVGEPERADAQVLFARDRIDMVRRFVADAPRPSVLLWADTGFTPAAGTLFCDVVGAAGGRCAAADAGMSGYSPLTLERLVELDPEVIVVHGYRADGRARSIAPTHALSGDPRLGSLRAVREGRVIAIEASLVLTTSHHVATTVERLAHVLHPELFERGAH